MQQSDISWNIASNRVQSAAENCGAVTFVGSVRTRDLYICGVFGVFAGGGSIVKLVLIKVELIKNAAKVYLFQKHPWRSYSNRTFRVFDLRRLGTGQAGDSARDLVGRQGYKLFVGKRPIGFGSVEYENVENMTRKSGHTSVARPLRTIFSISDVIIPRASSMKASYDATTLMERRGIGAVSDDGFSWSLPS
jgi:hypothetical protein